MHVRFLMLFPILLFVATPLGCGQAEDEQADSGPEMRFDLKPGETRRVSLPASRDELAVGIECVSEVTGGVVRLQQVGEVSQISTGTWASRSWIKDQASFEFELVNESEADVVVRVFIGSEP